MNYRNVMLSGAAVIVVAGILGNPAAFAAEPLKITKDQAKLVGIETAVLSQTAGAASQGFLARVVIPPQKTRHVGAIMGGRIETLLVAPEQMVRQGQPLAQITSPELLKAQLEYIQSVSQEQYLRETLGREQALSQDRVVSPKQVMATRNELTNATAATAERRLALQMTGMADSAIAALAASRVPVGAITVQSPMEGAVIDVAASVGQNIEAGGALLKIAQLSVLWLEVQVPAAQISRVELGAEVIIPGVDAKGKITAIGSTVDATSQAITVRAEIDNQDAKLRPGQFVETRVQFAQGRDLKYWNVPPASLVRMGSDVFVLKEIESGYQPVAVQVQHESTDITMITGELSGEDKIAVRGLVALKGAMRGLGGGE
ncbi:efflux RND transporter periplasmic adaptor subunit [Ferrovibrio sp.]|uniref:efflux RND transporter periplasmic adaptor subunit n=1 Tax=Ferrovibrio sp. TaxID=1917215 RepID=UPI001B72801B|nr:efflux RND transporter periplasmic adaptor subunit [Ferrovibrio sp.]MBP7065173.1 efflux RND transporter periplasmic adaptor subunit [Ferrovibrio sp.]